MSEMVEVNVNVVESYPVLNVTPVMSGAGVVRQIPESLYRALCKAEGELSSVQQAIVVYLSDTAQIDEDVQEAFSWMWQDEE